MISIIFNTREPSTQENVSCVLDFYVSGDVSFSHFGELKNKFFISLHFAYTSYVLKSFGYLEVGILVTNSYKGKPRIFLESILQI